MCSPQRHEALPFNSWKCFGMSEPSLSLCYPKIPPFLTFPWHRRVKKAELWMNSCSRDASGAFLPRDSRCRECLFPGEQADLFFVFPETRLEMRDRCRDSCRAQGIDFTGMLCFGSASPTSASGSSSFFQPGCKWISPFPSPI